MCGIIGYLGSKLAAEILVDGLKRMEYRGYDSAGIALVQNGDIVLRRNQGKIIELEKKLAGEKFSSTFGLGHTRWATHGRPSEENAHPHRSANGRIVVVHNGIIENFLELKDELKEKGYKFTSETDTETIAHLVEDNYSGDIVKAAQAAAKRLKGAFAIGLYCLDEEKIIGLRDGPPLIVATAQHGNILASDLTAILEHTKDVYFVEDGETAIIERNCISFETFDGEKIEKEMHHITWDPITAQKGGYRHYMLKEIHDQPRALRDTIRGRLDFENGDVFLKELDNLGPNYFREINNIYLVACGTAWHACLVGKFLIERFTDLHAEVDYASEFRYRDPKIGARDMLVAVSQSGETADTLAGLRDAKAKGCKIVSVVNVVSSTVARESDGVIYTHAGPEIGVASTKAFTTQITCLLLLAIRIARSRGTMSSDKANELMKSLLEIPQKVKEILDREEEIKVLSKPHVNRQDFLYLGRGINYPIALEGALKLKEISYIHAEGYPAGEMKHGPIALIDENMPTVALCPRNAYYDKMISNIMEVKARDGQVIIIGENGDSTLDGKIDQVFFVPHAPEELMPILLTIPLQLIAYHIAVWRGCDVDQPRNLAKSVTVE